MLTAPPANGGIERERGTITEGKARKVEPKLIKAAEEQLKHNLQATRERLLLLYLMTA